MPRCKPTCSLLRLFCAALLAFAAINSRAAAPAFLLSVSNASPKLSELVEVTPDPFTTAVIAVTNGETVFTNGAGWSTLAFSPAGTLYGTSLNGSLAAIDPSTAASTIFANLADNNNVPVPATGLAFGTNGEAYALDGGANLYTANLVTGLCTQVGALSGAGVAGPPLVLAAAPNGSMFGLFLGLYKINLTNAQLTQVGPTLIFGSSTPLGHARGAAFGSDGNLYAVAWNGELASHPVLYIVNTNNGSSAALGELPLGASALAGFPASNSGAPAVVLPPFSLSAMEGSPAAFVAAGSGMPSPQAQWYFAGAPLGGATNFSLGFTNVSPTNAGNYYVVLTNTNGMATSPPVALTVAGGIIASSGSNTIFAPATNSVLVLTTNPPTASVLLASNWIYPSLCFDPVGNLFAAGRYTTIQISENPPIAELVSLAALFRINIASGSTNLIANFQTNQTALQVPPTGLAFSPSGVLYGVLGGRLYTVNTNNGLMTAIGAFPAGVAVNGIAFAPNGILYGGETNLYQINPTNAAATKIAALSGAATSILADMKYGPDNFLYFLDDGPDDNLYRLDSASGLVTVAAQYAAPLSGLAFVPAPPTFATQPTNQIIPSGSAASFSVAASSSGLLHYQWYFNSAKIAGGTNPVLNITNAVAKNTGKYFVVVSNSLGAATSSVVILENYAVPVITQPPVSPTNILSGRTISLSVKATGVQLSYQWQLDGTNLPGKTAATLIIPLAGPNNGGTYTVVVSSPYAIPVSASSIVSVTPLTPTTTAPANNLLTGTQALTVSGSEPIHGGAAAILYQLNGAPPKDAALSSNGLTWSAAIALASGTNTFTVWASNVFGISGVVTTHYAFHPFLTLAGVYNGLFFDAAAPAFTNAGYFNLTIATNRDFSGDILLDGAMTSFSGEFDTNGYAELIASNAPGPGYDLTMQLDFSGVNPLAGSVSNTTQAWTSSLTAYRAAFSTKATATNYVGSYVLAVTGAFGYADPSNAPPGYSYALATVSSTGAVTIPLGTMADGTTFSASSAISKNGDWPVYATLNSGKGSFLGWVKIPRHSAALQAAAGDALWFETAASPSGLYPNGFSLSTNALSVQINPYTPPPRGVAVLRSTNYTIALFAGNLPDILADTATINGSDVFKLGPNTNKLTITIFTTTASFNGSFVNPTTGLTNLLQGILLPQSDAGYGYFLSTNQAGGILIQH